MKSNKNLIVCASVCECVLVAQLCPTLCDSMDIAHKAPLSMGFSRRQYWNGLPFPSPGIFLTQGLNLGLRRLFTIWSIREALKNRKKKKKNSLFWSFFFFTYKEYVARSRQSVNPWWINEWMTTFDICPGGSMHGCKKSELWNQTTWVWGSEILILVAGRA